MSDINNCTFTGRLTKDAVMKTLPTGTQLCTFSLANNRGWGNNEKVLFMDINLWGKKNESLCQYLLKGKPVGVTGEIEVQKWTSQQDGQQHQKLVLNCQDIVLMNSGQKKDDQPTHRFEGEAQPISNDDIAF